MAFEPYITFHLRYKCSAFFKGPYSSQCNEAQHSDLPFMGAKRKDIHEKCSVVILALNLLYLKQKVSFTVTLLS